MHKTLLLILFLAILIQVPAVAMNPHNVTFGEIKAERKIWGIDISHHQSNINWGKLKTQKPHFVFLKASEGATQQDNKYLENYNAAKNLGILVGSYHFFTYRSSGKDQAENFLSIARHKSGDLPLVLDAEFTRNMPASRLVGNELITFINIVYRRTGHYPMIYCDYRYYKLYLKSRLHTKCKLWIVDYNNKPDCNWTFWQTTNKFKIAGIRGNVDFNLFNGSKKKLKRILY